MDTNSPHDVNPCHLAIVGRIGHGKTTLLNAILKVLRPRPGRAQPVGRG